ncbi:replication initiation protein [Nonomuraea sp. NBC_01738]|uniref:replication initiator n=1 Tax=Nonomuraea sp. NBC_01738 TaxID=2976003 RepID=UPI002E0FAF29|nr:replication initiation protein [Nonomuraea sp. NBC_01738]
MAAAELGASVLNLETITALAEERGVCVRPLAFRVTDRKDGTSRVINISCGARAEAVCAPCAYRVRSARREQLRDGWHLEEEPEALMAEIGRDRVPDSDESQWLSDFRAELILLRDTAAAAGDAGQAADWAAALAAHEAEMAWLGVQIIDARAGAVEVTPVEAEEEGKRRVRSTARRQDAPALPKRKRSAATVGRTYAAAGGGKGFRPSMFLTLTMPSYGRVRDGVPVDPDAYDYRRAARDLIHFSKLVDRFVQNLRRVAGFTVQYFAAVEPQRRLAPHLHMAMRGTVARADLRAVVAATYHQVWWPSTDVLFEGAFSPVWQEGAGYLVPGTGEILPTWEEALDALEADAGAEPHHVIRLGGQFDAQGILGGTPEADQRIGYLTKYLTKSVGDVVGVIDGEDHDDDGGPELGQVRRLDAGLRRARRAHALRLLETLRWEPCSPSCANWLRYGVQPDGARAGLVPGRCPGRAHRAGALGCGGGRRVLVSRRWSSRTLGGVQRDRRAWIAEALGLADELGREADPARWEWVRLKANDPSLAPLATRLLWMIAEREQQAEALARARGDTAGSGEGGVGESGQGAAS